MAHTLEQVREQIRIVKERLEEGRPLWRQLKKDHDAARAAGDKDEMKKIAAQIDTAEKVRVDLKADLYALMAEETEMARQQGTASA